MAAAMPVRILHLAETDSTNSEALRLAALGERGPLWVVAERQTQGRGRSGRAWQSEAGNLTASFLFVPGCAPSNLQQLSLLAGVAVHDALTELLGPTQSLLRLKWPNDCLIGMSKLGGILVETTNLDGQAIAVIGFGINCVNAPTIDRRDVTSLIQHGCHASRDDVLRRLQIHLPRKLVQWQTGDGFNHLRDDWLARSGPIGQPLTVNAGNTRIAGTFAGLDGDGALLLHDEHGAVRRLTHGDVTLTGTTVLETTSTI